MGDALNGGAGTSPEEMLHAARESVDAFARDVERLGDPTLFRAESQGADRVASNASVPKELTLEATLENTRQAIDFVTGELDSLQCTTKARAQLQVAVDELVSNVARHAYAPNAGDVTVRFAALEDGSVAEVTVIDSGAAYNPLEAGEPDARLAAKKRRIGGLGILLVKRTMDEMEYERKDGMNILRIRKQLGKEPLSPKR